MHPLPLFMADGSDAELHHADRGVKKMKCENLKNTTICHLLSTPTCLQKFVARKWVYKCEANKYIQ